MHLSNCYSIFFEDRPNGGPEMYQFVNSFTDNSHIISPHMNELMEAKAINEPHVQTQGTHANPERYGQSQEVQYTQEQKDQMLWKRTRYWEAQSFGLWTRLAMYNKTSTIQNFDEWHQFFHDLISAAVDSLNPGVTIHA